VFGFFFSANSWRITLQQFRNPGLAAAVTASEP